MTDQYKQDPPQKPILGYASMYNPSVSDFMILLGKLNSIENILKDLKDQLDRVEQKMSLR